MWKTVKAKKNKKSFPEGSKAFALLATRCEGNTSLMLCLSFFLLVSAGVADQDFSSDSAKGYLANVHTVLWNHETETWCSPAEGCRLVWEELKARPALVTLHVFPFIRQNSQSAECFTANHFRLRKKTKLMNLGKENSVLEIPPIHEESSASACQIE